MFQRGETVLVTCQLTRSGFSSERIFRIDQADQAEHIGAAPVHYCWTEEGKRLNENSPAKGKRISGLVQPYVISNGGLKARIETPDGENIEVDTSAVKHPDDVQTLEPYYNVPVRS